MSYSDDQLRAVGGWLAFLVISLMALGPVVDVVRTWGDLSSAQSTYPHLAASPIWATVKVVIWTMVLVQVAMMIYTGWRLNNVFRRSVVKFTIAMLWVIGPILGVLMLAAMGFLAGRNPFNPKTLFALAQPTAWAFAWTLYLLMSRRVANTYDEEGPEVGEAGLANVFE